MLHVSGAQPVQHLDDLVLANVCGIRHGRAPATVRAPACRLVDEPRIAQNQFANRFRIAAPDGVRHAAGDDQPRPARQPLTSRKDKLRIGQLGVLDRFLVMVSKFGNGCRVSSPNGAE
jgi:hypothetical protein